mgnify:CR=1 FL=1
MKLSTVKDIMTKQVVSVSPETSIIEVQEILYNHKFDGAPVVDPNGRLIGIITEYDLLTKGSAIHLPTFQKILSQLPIFSKDQFEFKKEVEEISSLKVKDVMNKEPFILYEDASFEEAVRAFQEHHRVNPIPIIDKEHKVRGIVSRCDVIKLFSLLK